MQNVNTIPELRQKNLNGTGAYSVYYGNYTENPLALGFSGALTNDDTFEKETLEALKPADINTINDKNSQISSVYAEFKEIKSSNGPIGKLWDGIKNLFNLKNGSNNVEEVIKKAENGEITEE